MKEIKKNQNNVKNEENDFLSYFKIIIFSFIISFLITRLICPTLVSGLSMYPTLNDNQYLIVSKISDYSRGDIITFKNPKKNNKVLIKRVIGIPGDTIEIKDGHVYRNDKELNEPYINEPYITEGAEGKITVADNHIFVMGDNRGNSLDSRYDMVGQVDKSNIIGKVILSIYPFETNFRQLGE